MVRVSLLIWVIVIVAVAVAVYQVTYEAQQLEQRLQQVRAEIREEREALHVLEGEWAYLNRPARLARLAAEYLGMVPLAPEQIVAVVQIPPRITRPLEPDDEARPKGPDGMPLPARKPWSLQPQISQAPTPFGPEAPR